jgi:hypothetical protein
MRMQRKGAAQACCAFHNSLLSHCLTAAAAHLRQAWNWVMEPLLFGTIGASIQYAKLADYTIGRAVGLVTAGAGSQDALGSKACPPSAQHPQLLPRPRASSRGPLGLSQMAPAPRRRATDRTAPFPTE